MKLKRHPMVAAGPAPTAGTASRSHHLVPRAVKLLSVTAVAATTCALWALPAGAATQRATTTTVSVAKSAFVGASVNLSATVRSSGAAPAGTVTFWLGTRKLCHGTLSKGSTHCSARFYSINTKTITGKYSGNSTHKASSGTAKLKVVRSHTTTKIANLPNPSNVDSGAAFTFHVTVTVPAGTPAATGFVTVAPTSPAGLSAAFRCTATLAAGKGSCTIHPPGFGIVDYQASYSGSPVHISSKSAAGAFGLAVQNTTTTTVAPATAAPGAVTLIATVVNQAESDISPPDGNGTVAFYVDGAVVCPAQPLTDASAGPDNLATCDDTLAAGTYTIDAVYSGDDTNVTSTGTVTLVVS
jgi:large repetitive protein